MARADRMDKFKNRLPCKIAVCIEMTTVAVMLIVLISMYSMEAFKFMKERGNNMNLAEVHFFSIMGYCIVLLGHICDLVLLVAGVRVLGACTLSPTSTDIVHFKRSVKCCKFWCTLEFLRFILLLLGLSIRLMVFSLLTFDDLTDYEIARQSTIILPLSTILIGRFFVNKYKKELVFHLKNHLNCGNGNNFSDSFQQIITTTG